MVIQLIIISFIFNYEHNDHEHKQYINKINK